jgi:hypothetical protein
VRLGWPRIRGTLADLDTVEILRGEEQVKDAHGRMTTQHAVAATLPGQPLTVSVLVRSRRQLPRWLVTVSMSWHGGMWQRADSCWTEWGARRRATKLQVLGRERLARASTRLGPHD